MELEEEEEESSGEFFEDSFLLLVFMFTPDEEAVLFDEDFASKIKKKLLFSCHFYCLSILLDGPT